MQFTEGRAAATIRRRRRWRSSKIRDILFGIERRPKYTGQAVWRATVGGRWSQGRVSYFGPRNKAGFNPVSNERCISISSRTSPTFVRISPTINSPASA